MADEFIKWLHKEGGEHIFESYDISFQNTPTSHAVSLGAHVVILQCLFVMLLLTTNGFCLHLLVPSLVLLLWYFLHNITACTMA